MTTSPICLVIFEGLAEVLFSFYCEPLYLIDFCWPEFWFVCLDNLGLYSHTCIEPWGISPGIVKAVVTHYFGFTVGLLIYWLSHLISEAIYSTLPHYDIPDRKTALRNCSLKICDIMVLYSLSQWGWSPALASCIYTLLAAVLPACFGCLSLFNPLGKWVYGLHNRPKKPRSHNLCKYRENETLIGTDVLRDDLVDLLIISVDLEVIYSTMMSQILHSRFWTVNSRSVRS